MSEGTSADAIAGRQCLSHARTCTALLSMSRRSTLSGLSTAKIGIDGVTSNGSALLAAEGKEGALPEGSEETVDLHANCAADGNAAVCLSWLRRLRRITGRSISSSIS